MLKTITASAIFIALGTVVNFLYPISIPDTVQIAIVEIVGSLWYWNGFFPVDTLMTIIMWDAIFLVSWIIFKLINNLLAGKVDIE